MKKALSILAILFVSVALFAAADTTVKIGAAYDNFKTTVPVSDDFPNKIITTGDGFGVEGAVMYDMPNSIVSFMDFNLVFFNDAKAQFDVAGHQPISVKYFYDYFSDYEKNQFYFNFFSYSGGVAKRFDFRNVRLYVGGGLSVNRLWLKSSVSDGLGVGVTKIEYTVVDRIIGVTAYVEGRFMITDRFGISLSAKPQVGIYNKHTETAKITYPSPAGNSEYKKTSRDFAISYAMPVALSMAFSF